MEYGNRFLAPCQLILIVLLLFSTSSLTQAKQPDGSDWSIANLAEKVPEKYKTFEGDFAPPSEETTIIDQPKGYFAYLSNLPDKNSNNPPFPILEMALFNSKTSPPLLVVSNIKSDSVCNEYETFFLRHVGSEWAEVHGDVLPQLDWKMFWEDPKSAARFAIIISDKSAVSYHFEPPRTGTRMKVSLEICDYVTLEEEDTPPSTAKELSKLIEMAKPIYLEWEKQKGKFTFPQ